MRKSFVTLPILALCSLATHDAGAVAVNEWALPPGVSELDIDASQGGPVALVEPAGMIDQFDPTTSLLTQWNVGPALVFAPPGQIQNHVAAAPFIFVTDAPHARIGMLNIGAAQYDFWNISIAPNAQMPHALAVDHPTGQVWFTTYDGVNTPTVSMLDPATGTITYWPLPPAFATPAQLLNGIVVTRASGTLLVYVSSDSANSALLEINPSAGTARMWPMSYGGATRIAVDNTGEIFGPIVGTNQVTRLRPATNQEMVWADANFVFQPFVSIDSAQRPLLPSTNGGAAWISRLNPGGVGAVIGPTPLVPVFLSAVVPTNVVPATRSAVALPFAAVPTAPVGPAPFANYHVPGNVPLLSCDPTVALSTAWFLDISTNSVARLQ